MQSLLKHIYYGLFPPAFLVRIRDGKAVAVRGKLAPSVLAEFSAVAHDSNIKSCTIFGVKRPHGIALDFANLPNPSNRQRFRNVWTAAH